MTHQSPVQLQVTGPAIRVDQYLAKNLASFSRSQIKKLIKANKVLILNNPVKPGTVVQPGDFITLYLPASEPAALVAETLPLDVVYEDDHLVVVNKAAGMVVHPAHGHNRGTLVNALLARYPNFGAMIGPDSALRPGIVHRLDQDTSGLMVVARTPAALQNLQAQFKARTVEKTYLALVFGHPDAPEGVIDVPLGRDYHQRQKIAPRAGGKAARTHYRVKTFYNEYSLLEIGLETGRTHQIRVHLAWLKCPVVGDTVYGRKKNLLGLKRQFLHAWRLAFRHPQSDNPLQFEVPPDNKLQQVLDRLAAGQQ